MRKVCEADPCRGKSNDGTTSNKTSTNVRRRGSNPRLLGSVATEAVEALTLDYG